MVEKLGWYKPKLDRSLDWIGELDLAPDSPIIDIGGGASTLVDDLVDEGFDSITVLDISESALEASRKRLGRQSDLVMWLSGDITDYLLPEQRFALWHDRAMFHFLTSDAEQAAYRKALLHTLQPDGHAIIGAFANSAPPTCSGLPVCRYDAAGLSEILGDGLQLLDDVEELHVTPGGVEQMYLYCLFRRTAAG